MAGGGSRPGERRGGRKKGVPNKASAARQAEVKASGSTPLEVILRRMRYHEARATAAIKRGDKDIAERHLKEADDAARAAAPYVHPKLQAIQHSGKPGEPIEVQQTLSRNEMARRIYWLLHMPEPK